MTHNQIAYQANKIQETRNLEEARHNRELEANARYATKVQEAYNQVQAALRQNELYEIGRHNREQEMLQRTYNETQARLGQANLLLTSSRYAAEIQETQRSNQAREEETSRHNRVTEALDTRKQEEVERQNQWNRAMDLGNLFLNSVDTAFKGFRSAVTGAKDLATLLLG